MIAEQVGVTGVAPSTVAEYIRRLQRAQRQRVSGAAESSVVVVPDFTLGGDAFLQVRVPR